MKNLFFVVAFLMANFMATAQTEELIVEDKDAEINLSALNITMHFSDLADLKRFNEKDLAELALFKNLKLKPNFSFGFTLGEEIKLPNSLTVMYNTKVTITDQDNVADLIKEIGDAMDGIIELQEVEK